MLRYFAQLSTGKTILWCYLIWYVMTVSRYFDPTPAIWLNSLGISIVIGLALVLSVSNANGRTDRWQLFRLFLMPFCVSSFSSLIKDQGFFLVFPPTLLEVSASLAACAVFVGAVMSLGYFARSRAR